MSSQTPNNAAVTALTSADTPKPTSPDLRLQYYGDIALQIGSAGAFRAVGLANVHNPIGILVPCHRVIGANGSLTGYGGGLDRKRHLLEMERNRLFPVATLFD